MRGPSAGTAVECATRRHGLIAARHVLTGEVKYFLSNRVPGEASVRRRRRVAFGRWSIKSCFREGQEERGLDHDDVRGWQCVHRHFSITQRSRLCCARVRQEYDESSAAPGDRLRVAQVSSAMNVWLQTADSLPPPPAVRPPPSAAVRRRRFPKKLHKQPSSPHRNRQARPSHTNTRPARLAALGIHAEQTTSCLPDRDSP
ncbi:MAG: hypothetical protein AB7I48_06425 [Planctomycetaceae bacterium]